MPTRPFFRGDGRTTGQAQLKMGWLALPGPQAAEPAAGQELLLPERARVPVPVQEQQPEPEALVLLALVQASELVRVLVREQAPRRQVPE